MIKVYGMDSCPDCVAVKEEILARSEEFEYIEIGSHVKKLKEFIHLRDQRSEFDEIVENGGLGIPCFVKEDGQILFDPLKVGLHPEEKQSAAE